MTSTTLFVVMVAVGSVGKSASLRLYYCRHSIPMIYPMGRRLVCTACILELMLLLLLIPPTFVFSSSFSNHPGSPEWL